MSIKRLTFAAVSLAGAMTLAACGGDDDASSSDVVATVNGTDITTEQVDSEAELLAQPAGGSTESPPAEPEQEQLTSGLNELVRVQILVDGASDLGIEVTEEDIAATRDELVVQFGGEEEFYTALEEEQGMDREEVDRRIEIQATQDAVIADLTEDITDDEIQTAYDDGAPARHILVADEATANDALDRLDGGEAFADVAADVSTDQASAQNGGDLGFTPPGSVVPEFEDALFGAEEGEVVGPVQTQYGFHIIERMAKPALDEVRDQIQTRLEQMRGGEAQQEFSELFQEWVTGAEVTIHDSEYGVWNAENGGVIPPDSGEEGSGDSNTPGDTQPEEPAETEDPGGGDDTSDQ